MYSIHNSLEDGSEFAVSMFTNSGVNNFSSIKEAPQKPHNSVEVILDSKSEYTPLENLPAEEKCDSIQSPSDISLAPSSYSSDLQVISVYM